MTGNRSKKKFFAVRIGRRPGIYTTWAETQAQVERYPRAVHKSFPTRMEAEAWLGAGSSGGSGGGNATATREVANFTGSSDGELIKLSRLAAAGFSAQATTPATLQKKRSREAATEGEQGGAAGTNSPHFFSSLYPRQGKKATASQIVDLTQGSDCENIGDFDGHLDSQLTSEIAPSGSHLFQSEARSGPTELLFGSPRVSKPAVPLTDEQNRVLDLILEGRNVFFTGPAGTGKSLILQHVKYHLAKKAIAYAVTAPTGIAAVQLEGTTIHSFSGVGLGDKGISEYISMSMTKKTTVGRAKGNWLETRVLIIDEISMLNPDLWEKLNALAKAIREHTGFFGGMQVVVSGDFYQLPPVPDNVKKCQLCGSFLPKKDQRYYEPKPPKNAFAAIGIHPSTWCVCQKCYHPWNEGVKYVFQTRTWQEANFATVILSQVHRQTDKQWVEMLGQIKIGNVTEEILDYLWALRRPLAEIGGIKPTRLYTHRANVQHENEMEFRKLKQKEYVIEAIDSGTIKSLTHIRQLVGSELDNYFFTNLQSYRTLRLKEGAQVMLLKNIDSNRRLANGSRGVVVGFQEYNLGNLLAEATENERKVYLTYFHQHCDKEKQTVSLPRVRYRSGEGEPIHIGTVFPSSWTQTSSTSKGTQTLERIQLPLALAWAVTIHKAQGLSLDYATVDISNAFEPGQSYVGLSRCRTPQGLQILGDDRERIRQAIKCCQTVFRFDQILQKTWRQNWNRGSRSQELV